MSRKKTDIYPTWTTFPALMVYSVFYILPLFASLILCVTNWNSLRFWNPSFIGIENFVNIFGDDNFTTAFGNTLLFAVVTTAVKTVFGLLLALALVRPLRMVNLLRTVFYLPAVISAIAVGLVFSAIFKSNGMFTDFVHAIGLRSVQIDWLGNPSYSFPIIMLTDIWMWCGFSMVIFIAGLQSIPKEFYEASSIDGASGAQAFWHITAPMLSSTVRINIMLAIIGGLRVFTQVFILTAGGPGYQTDVLSRYVYSAFGQGFWGKASAASVVQTVLILAITLVFNKYMSKKEVELS